jgi:CRP/FNR family transcriptional regulator, cyclic AMP receptor protein
MRDVASINSKLPNNPCARDWKSLPDQMVRELLSYAQPWHFKKRQELFCCGDPSDGCFWLNSGFVKTSVPATQDDEQVIRILGPGSIIGDLDMIVERARSESVTALTDCKLQFVSRANFHMWALRHPDIYRHLLFVLADRVKETETNIAALVSLSAKARVARALLMIAKMMGQKIKPNSILIPEMIPQKELAALARVARENTNRILKNWERTNLLSVSLQSYRINDAARLVQELDQLD